MSPYRRTAAEVDADLMAAHDAKMARLTVERGLLLAAADDLDATDSGGYALDARAAKLLATAMRRAAQGRFDMVRVTLVRLAEALVIDEEADQ